MHRTCRYARFGVYARGDERMRSFYRRRHKVLRPLVANVNKYSPGVRVLHMDIDEAEIDKNIHAFSSVCGDLGTALRSLSKLVNPRPAPWITAERFPAEHPSPYIYRVLSELCRDAVFTTEVGLHQLGACENMRINKPRRFITSGGLGTMDSDSLRR